MMGYLLKLEAWRKYFWNRNVVFSLPRIRSGIENSLEGSFVECLDNNFLPDGFLPDATGNPSYVETQEFRA